MAKKISEGYFMRLTIFISFKPKNMQKAILQKICRKQYNKKLCRGQYNKNLHQILILKNLNPLSVMCPL